MRETRGDLWVLAQGATLILTTNGAVRKDGACVMDRGIAKEAITRFPDIAYKLGTLLKVQGNHVHDLGVWTLGSSTYRILSFPVKHHWREVADRNLIERSARELVAFVNQQLAKGVSDIYLPRPGCGNGSLSWEFIKPLLEPILDDRFIVATF